VIVQIYGITTAEDAAGVASLRPDFAGVVLDEGIDTWDSVDDATARAIVAELRGHVRAVALSLATDRERIRRTVDRLEPDVVHLARAADGMDADALATLRDEVRPVEVMTTIPVRGPEALEVARALAPMSDYLLLDTAHPGSGVVGATGHVHDWTHSAGIVVNVDARVILAGGLGPDNVAGAIAEVRPWGVDSETRTSRPDDRRRKDIDAVRRFIETARATVSAG
jgi:phosphoribosylanthranilate isomerase